MKIPLPACIPFDIVGHRIGAPVRRSTDKYTETSQPVRRSFLPFKLSRRPSWAEAGASSNAPGVVASASVMDEIHTPVAPPTSMTGHLRLLQDWIDGGPEAERSQRQEVGEKVRECWTNPRQTRLDIIGKNFLTSLPPIPTTLTRLTVMACQSLNTPPDLSLCTQLTLLRLRNCVRLTKPPDLSHCTQLATLDMSGSRNLLAPPDLSHCTELSQLYMSDCSNLRTPPDLAHCQKMSTVDLSGNLSLTELPDLTQCRQLEMLWIDRCSRLSAPPDLTQCTQLSSLAMADCVSMRTLPNIASLTQLARLSIPGRSQITSLPALGHLQQLAKLHMAGTPLTSLPEDILRLPPSCHIELNVSGLSGGVWNRLDRTLNTPGYSGPRINYMSNAGPHATAAERPLDQEVAAWFAEAAHHPEAGLDQPDWRRLSTEDNAASFSRFLSRIRDTNDYRNATPALKAATQQRVASLLAQLKTDPALRERCLILAFDGVEQCEDRVALRLLDMEMQCQASSARNAIKAGDYDANPQALIDLCKGQYRLQVLAQHASEKTARMNLVDEIEVHLGYLVHFSDRYQLPVRISTMLYPLWSHLTEQDIANADARLTSAPASAAVRSENDKAYREFLATSPLIHDLLEHLAAPAMRTANADSAQQMAAGKADIRAREEQLDPDAPGYLQTYHALAQEFSALETKVRTVTTLPLVMNLLQQRGISASL